MPAQSRGEILKSALPAGDGAGEGSHKDNEQHHCLRNHPLALAADLRPL